MRKPPSASTIRDVARKAGVSVATVSRYLNQTAVVSAGLSRRIQEVMDELDYVPQASARHLALQKTNAIGLLLTNMNSHFFGPLMAGIEQVVRSNGCDLLVATARPVQAGGHIALGPHNVDGLLIFADSLSEERIRLLNRRQFPMVLIHRTPAVDLNLPFVTVENKTATRGLVRHLITAHGRRRIMFLRGPHEQEDSYWREEGYRAALAEFNIPYAAELVLSGSFAREIAYETLRDFLADPDRPDFDAVFAGSDAAAIGVYEALKEAGVNIPSAVSVVGFDDALMAPFLNPPLTTVRAPTEAVGRTAAEQLFLLLSGKKPEQSTLHATTLVLRRSCGCDYPPA